MIGQKLLDTLDALSAADPLFTPWNVLDKPAMAALPLITARPRIAAIVEKNVVRDDDGQPEPAFGYRPIGVTDNPIASRITTLTVDAGWVIRESTVLLEFGGQLAPTDLAIVNYPRFRQALVAMTALWQPAWACTHAHSEWIIGRLRSLLARRYSL